MKKTKLFAALAALTLASLAQAATLLPGQSLTPGQSVSSDSGAYTLVMQGDGNLVMYQRSNMSPIWYTKTDGNPGAAAVMQGDGNLVVYSTTGTALWNSRTAGNAGAYLNVQDDRNLVVYRADGKALWHSDTYIRPEPPKPVDPPKPVQPPKQDCPGNPGGAQIWFSFCLTKPAGGWWEDRQSTAVTACNYAQAKALAQSRAANYIISDGMCR
ncbi:hypothetical protein [Parachitinimonas caeni]|uniref:Bulb-type lectin domain-containing protein n=1 Tax=Parachitinimonas caeni TaxID=3031301 RepID=A0ABT7E069_9NEIS|nr:hypothetical protein [Parachitinimonas caeni]MDK2125698.1 hypothetical protein [Parachitinimonas caeni]